MCNKSFQTQKISSKVNFNTSRLQKEFRGLFAQKFFGLESFVLCFYSFRASKHVSEVAFGPNSLAPKKRILKEFENYSFETGFFACPVRILEKYVCILVHFSRTRHYGSNEANFGTIRL